MSQRSSSPIVSVVVRTRDEADRLRLVLTSLAAQTIERAAMELIVVNDGSVDHTAEVLSEASGTFELRVIHHPTARGRSAASNAGAAIATGAVLLFLDGDVLLGREGVERHAALHTSRQSVVGRGETYHLRCTRSLLDPETATPRPSEEARIGRISSSERDRLRVTRRQIIDDPASIDRRAEPGIYPGSGPRRLYEIEMDALENHSTCGLLWAAAAGHNLSVGRDAFLKVGGFDEALDLNEHRELALRLHQHGHRLVAVRGARSYHLTHRSGWRDPLVETAWESTIHSRHPMPVVKLLVVLWGSLSGDERIPRSARIESLPALEQAARGVADIDYEEIRRALSAPVLR